MRWRTFCRHIVDLAEALGTQLVVTMGALLADVPHSHPVSITGLASDPGARREARRRRDDVRGPDRDRRRPAHGVQRRGPAVGEPVGERPALRRRRAEPEGRARARAQDREPRRGVGRRDRPRERDERLRAPGLARRAVRSRGAGVRRAPRGGRRARTRRRSGPASCPPATRSPPSSSASSSSRARALSDPCRPASATSRSCSPRWIPELHPGRYVFALAPGDGLPPDLDIVATVREAEGLTLVLPAEDADRAGLCVRRRDGVDHAARALRARRGRPDRRVQHGARRRGLSANVIAGLHHDHVFVPAGQGEPAVQVLRALSAASRPEPGS